MFAGSMVALVTPMLEGGAIDYESLAKLLDWHLKCETDAILILGTTGESPTISSAERAEIIKKTVAQIAGKVPVIVGTGTNDTKQSVLYTKQAMDFGADACLLVVPYYNRPSQEGLYQHFATIAQAVNIPQILYNIPGRSSCDLSVATTIRLASDYANIIGLKDVSNDFARIPRLLKDTELALYSGEDASACCYMQCGGKGVISVVANVTPIAMRDMCAAVLTGNTEEARRINESLLSWQQNLFVESNPVPAKYILHKMGMIQSPAVRLPLVGLSAASMAILDDAFAKLNLN
jgi:4-hydroxy-tetrahydrodipicolinate synthase